MAKSKLSLADFAVEKKREEQRKSCPICRLPDDIRAELLQHKGKIPRDLQAAWLASRGYKIDNPQRITSHYSAGHHT